MAAAVAFGLVLTLASACDRPAPAGGDAAVSDLQRPRAENARLARRVAELEVAVADARRARRTPMDQPVVRSWIARAAADDPAAAAGAFDLCIEFFAHGDTLDLLPNTLAISCRPFVPPDPGDPAGALRALLGSDNFACWSGAGADRPLPVCWR